MHFSVPYTGLNYYAPSPLLTRCPYWTWLQNACYRRRHYISSAREQLVADLTFMQRNHLGRFHRLWVSVDQVMRPARAGHYAGLDERALANLDDALHQFVRHRFRVDLVLLAYAVGTGEENQFHPESLDGRHDPMRRNYLRAVGALVKHLARNDGDRRAIAVIDLQNEAYYQLEVYFSDPAKLGAFGHCKNPSGRTDWGCVDHSIVLPWLEALYKEGKSAGPRFLFTVSDTGRLLTQFDQWKSMYPVDVYDIHVYDNQPWQHASQYIAGKKIDRPWFVGEAGCAVGNVACTYNGVTAAPVVRWWLDDLHYFGARAVLIENSGTAWGYAAHQRLTPAGQAISAAAAGR